MESNCEHYPEALEPAPTPWGCRRSRDVVPTLTNHLVSVAAKTVHKWKQRQMAGAADIFRVAP